MSDIDYDSNYDEIFKNYSSELNGQTPAINELDIHSSSGSSRKTNYGNENNEFFKDNGFVNSIGRQSNNTSSMVNFDIL